MYRYPDRGRGARRGATGHPRYSSGNATAGATQPLAPAHYACFIPTQIALWGVLRGRRTTMTTSAPLTN